jgi:hypothetical protein
MNDKKHPTATPVIPAPGEHHPGQTADHGPTHDQHGSQIESERHEYPNSNIPNAGSARTNKRPRIKHKAS